VPDRVGNNTRLHHRRKPAETYREENRPETVSGTHFLVAADTRYVDLHDHRDSHRRQLVAPWTLDDVDEDSLSLSLSLSLSPSLLLVALRCAALALALRLASKDTTVNDSSR